MNQPHPTLTKVCASCGLQKPLSAFLELSGTEGHIIYGNVCSSCRKTDKELKKEESTTSTSGVKIDSKVKTHIDIGKKQQQQNISEQYEEQRDKLEEKQVDHSARAEKVATGEKEHRKRYLEKSSFLDQTSKKTQENPVPLTPEERDAFERKIDLSERFLDTEIPGKLKYGPGSEATKYENLTFQRWISGKTSIFEQAKKTLQKEDKEPKKDESLIDQIEKNWGPKSRGR